MKRLLLVVVFACGSKTGPLPVSNVASPSAEPGPSSGEGSAKVIQRSATGGVIELSGNREAAMKQASNEIGKHCEPAGYVIVQEGEEIIEPTRSDGTSATAWRVHYRCDH